VVDENATSIQQVNLSASEIETIRAICHMSGHHHSQHARTRGNFRMEEGVARGSHTCLVLSFALSLLVRVQD